MKITPETARSALHRNEEKIAMDDAIIIENALTHWEQDGEKLKAVIADLEYRKSLCDKEVEKTENSSSTRHNLENMFSSGSSEALKYALTILKELIPK